MNRDGGDLDSINNTISNLNQLNNNNNNINLNQFNKYGVSQPIDMQQQDVEVSDIIITGSQPARLTQRDVSPFVSLSELKLLSQFFVLHA